MSNRKEKIYLASPFFNEEQLERVERIRNKLVSEGFDVYSPKDDAGILRPDSTTEQRSKVYESNVIAISTCDLVFAITDGKDVGTIWEAGYACGLNKPVMYYCETLGDNPFNVMLALSGRAVFKKDSEVSYGNIYNATKGITIKNYVGDIQ